MPFVTPDNLPTGLFCRQILIPNDPYWIGLVSGALLPFTYATEWEQKTGITPEEAAQRWLEMLNQFWMSQCEGDDGMPCEGGCPEVLRRVNPDSLQLEISTDGGSTWMQDPASPIAQIYAQPAPVPAGVSANKCDAATNGKQHIEDLIAGCSAQLATATSVFDLVVAVCAAVLEIALVLVSAGALIPLATALASAVWAAGHAAFELGQAAFDAYWTSDERDKILCALYNHIQDDGTFTQAAYDAFFAEWTASAAGGPAFNFVANALKATGLKGLNNFCSYGESADADCSDCSAICDYHLWDVWLGTGTLVSRGAAHITIAAVNGGDGHWYANVASPGVDTCCCFVEIDHGDVTMEAIGYNPCGESQADGSHLGFAYTGQPANAFALKAASSFTVTFTSSAECA